MGEKKPSTGWLSGQNCWRFCPWAFYPLPVELRSIVLEFAASDVMSQTTALDLRGEPQRFAVGSLASRSPI